MITPRAPRTPFVKESYEVCQVLEISIRPIVSLIECLDLFHLDLNTGFCPFCYAGSIGDISKEEEIGFILWGLRILHADNSIQPTICHGISTSECLAKETHTL